MGVHVCFSFFSAATYLVYAVGFHAQKEKSKYFFVRFARVFGYKNGCPPAREPNQKTSLDTCLIWLVVFCLMRCYLAANLCLGDQMEIPEFLVSLDSMVTFVFLKINLGLENPKLLANLGFEGHFLKYHKQKLSRLEGFSLVRK